MQGAVSLNIFFSSAIKGARFLQFSMEGIHTYSKSVTKANLFRATNFGTLKTNVKTLNKDLARITDKAYFLSKNPIKMHVNRKSLTDTKKDINAIERSAKRASHFSSQIKTPTPPKRTKQNYDSLSGVVGAVATASVIALPFKASIDFESEMTDVRALTKGVTDKEFIALTKEAKRLGATREWSATQSAEGMTFFAKAGFTATQQIQAMDGALGLATAGGIGLKETVDISSNVLSAYSMKASKMNYVSNVLAKTFTTSNTDLTMLGETMKYAGSMASGLGVGLSEVSALAGKLGDVGIQGSMAGTSLRQIYSRMSAPPTDARKAMDELGISAYNSKGKFKGLPNIIGEINQATKGMADSKKNKLIKDMFGMTALSGGIALLKAGKSTLMDYQLSLEGNEDAIARIRKMKLNTVTGQFKLLGSAFEGLSISATSGLLVPLKLIVGGITSVVTGVTWLTDTFPVMGGALVGLVSTVVVGTVALTAFGFASNMIGGSLATGISMFKSMIGFVRGLSLVTTIATAKQWLFNIALNANPIGLVVTGISALVGLGIVLYNNFKPVRELFNSIASLGGKFMSFLGFGSDDKIVVKDIKQMSETTRPINNVDYKPKSVTNSMLKSKLVQDIEPINNTYKLKTLEAPQTHKLQSYNAITEKYNNESISSSNSKVINQTIGDIHISVTATDGKVDVDSIKEQVLMAIKEAREDDLDTRLSDAS